MSYIKQNVQGSYEITPTDRNKSYLLALKNFLMDNGFEFVSEDYSNSGQENVVLQIGNMQYSFKTPNTNISNVNLNITISKLLDNNTINSIGHTVSIQLINSGGTIVDENITKYAYALSSTVLLIKNKNSFILIITASANSITSSGNYITGNIVYTLVDGTKSDIGFVNTDSFVAIEKSQGNPITFSSAHNKLDDDRLIYENKVFVNQSNMFVGDSDEIVGLVGAEKGKIYQTEKGKFLAFNADMGMLMGDEM